MQFENCAKGEPPVRPRRTIRAFFKKFRCQHHWVWASTGWGEWWGQCTFCRWVVKE